MKAIDIHGMTNMELVRGETDEWYWATDYIHGDLYEAEELFRQGHPVRSNRLYLIHYPDGTVYEAVSSTNRSHFDSDLCFLPPFARRIFRCFRPALPAPILFWVKTGSEAVISGGTGELQPCATVHTIYPHTTNGVKASVSWVYLSITAVASASVTE
jgi:hypothetical protein